MLISFPFTILLVAYAYILAGMYSSRVCPLDGPFRENVVISVCIVLTVPLFLRVHCLDRSPLLRPVYNPKWGEAACTRLLVTTYARLVRLDRPLKSVPTPPRGTQHKGGNDS